MTLVWSFLGVLSAHAISPQAQAFLEKSQRFLAKKNALAAVTAFQQAKAIDPEDAELLEFEKLLFETINKEAAEHLKAAEFYRQTDPPKAIEEYRFVLKLIPNHAEAKAGLAAMKEVEATVQKYREQGVVLDSGTGRSHDLKALSARDLYNRAKAAFEGKNFERAMDFITQALAQDPHFQLAVDLREKIVEEQRLRDLLVTARADLSTGDYSRAIDHYSNLLRTDPDRFDWLYFRGLAHLRTRRFPKAVEDFAGLILRWPEVSRWQADEAASKEGNVAGSAPNSREAESSKSMKIDRTQVLGFLAEAYAGAGEPLKAVAVGWEGGKAWSFLLRCTFDGYPVQISLMVILLGIMVAASIWSYRMLDGLIERFSFSRLAEMARLLWAGYRGRILDQEARLVALAERVNLPWFSYLAGLVLLADGKGDAAPRFFQLAFGSPAIAPRAYFFLGLARQSMQQSLGDHDFEQAFLAGMRDPDRPWVPGFLGCLEEAVVEKHLFPGPGSEKELRALAWQLIHR